MARGRSDENKLKAKWGQGEGKDYKPWFTVREVPSKGICLRICSWTVGRIHVLLSQLEAKVFYFLDWSENVVDIREQYPLLPLEETLEIAKNLGYRHPSMYGKYRVMTTDFLITLKDGRQVVRTVKYEKDLQDRRTREKLQIEKEYWVARGVDWGIITEKEIPKELVQNIEWIHSSDKFVGMPELNDANFKAISEAVERRLIELKGLPLSKITSRVDSEMGFEPGTALSVVKHCIATRKWIVDMSQRINPCKSLNVINFKGSEELDT